MEQWSSGAATILDPPQARGQYFSTFYLDQLDSLLTY